MKPCRTRRGFTFFGPAAAAHKACAMRRSVQSRRCGCAKIRPGEPGNGARNPVVARSKSYLVLIALTADRPLQPRLRHESRADVPALAPVDSRHIPLGCARVPGAKIIITDVRDGSVAPFEGQKKR